MIARSLTIHDITTSKKKNRHWKIKNAFVYSQAFLVHLLFIFDSRPSFHRPPPTPFSLSCLAFLLFFILFPFLFSIQCPSPYPPQPHTKLAVIAIAKKNNHNHPPPCTHTHHTMPLLSLFPSLFFNQPCVLCSCLVVLRVHLPCTCTCRSQAGATKNKKQETKKEWSNECTAWLAQRADMALGKGGGHSMPNMHTQA